MNNNKIYKFEFIKQKNISGFTITFNYVYLNLISQRFLSNVNQNKKVII